MGSTYVLGASRQAIDSLSRADMAGSDPEAVAAAVEYGMQLLSTGEFPHLSVLNEQLPGADSAGPAMTDEALADQF